MVEINLSAEDLSLAESEARRRQDHNESRGLRGRNRAPATGSKALQFHRLGCIGEVAAATFLGLRDGLFANSEPVRGSGDLPGGIDVKTRAKHSYDLLVQLRDDPGKRFLLVTYEWSGPAIVHGWCLGSDAMRETYIKTYVPGRTCYAVPQLELRNPEDLLVEIA